MCGLVNWWIGGCANYLMCGLFDALICGLKIPHIKMGCPAAFAVPSLDVLSYVTLLSVGIGQLGCPSAFAVPSLDVLSYVTLLSVGIGQLPFMTRHQKLGRQSSLCHSVVESA